MCYCVCCKLYCSLLNLVASLPSDNSKSERCFRSGKTLLTIYNNYCDVHTQRSSITNVKETHILLIMRQHQDDAASAYTGDQSNYNRIHTTKLKRKKERKKHSHTVDTQSTSQKTVSQWLKCECFFSRLLRISTVSCTTSSYFSPSSCSCKIQAQQLQRNAISPPPHTHTSGDPSGVWKNDWTPKSISFNIELIEKLCVYLLNKNPSICLN